MSRQDKGHGARWAKLWEDPMACRYRRADHADFWVWSHDFFEAPVEDLRHFAGLEVRFSVEGGVLRVREILEGTEP